MKQVNDTQGAVNNISTEIGTALEGVAQETTSQSIKTDTQTIINTLGSAGGGTDDSVVEMLQTVLNTPNVIKSIQYGVATLERNRNTTVTINTVNIQKSIVLLNGSVAGAESGGDNLATASPYLVSFTNDSLNIGPGCTLYYSVESAGAGHTSYQVVEFV